MSKTVKLEKKIEAKGHEIALELREMFRKKGIFVINLIGSPGGGKTSLLEALAKHFEGRAAVIEGDLATDNDKRRIEKAGLRAYQINTVGACHLDAAMVRDALKEFPLDDIDLLFIENVGNLVCPASFDIGENIKVVIVSLPEGEDKPAKYPKAMKVASAMVITKTDLLPYLTCNVERMERDVREIVPDMPVFRTAATTGEGIEKFLQWIEEQAAARKA
jgi:hydrogenase nickel incorporation protein HypB